MTIEVLRITDDTTPPPSEPPPTTEQDIKVATARLEQFMRQDAHIFGTMFGIPDLSIRVGTTTENPETGEVMSEGWSTNLETAEMTVDPSFFFERDYTVGEVKYSCYHELAAHLRQVVTDPSLTRQVRAFISPGLKPDMMTTQEAKARGIFLNIFSDIAGNKRMHAMLPDTPDIGAGLYSKKLFPEADYTDEPRHLQFLYKLIRQEMIPGSDTVVQPEVDDMLEHFHNYLGKVDLLEYSTQYAEHTRKVMFDNKKFEIWVKNIYPEWIKLYEMDKQDPRFQKKAPEDNQGQPGQPSPSDQTTPAEGEPDFSDYHDQYYEQHHPEPMTEEEHKAIEESVSQAERQKRLDKQEQNHKADPAVQRDAQLRQETGHGMQELRHYNTEREKWRHEIEAIRNIYRSLLNEHIGVRRRRRGGHTEGSLTPKRLAQTAVDIQTGIPNPRAFSKTEKEISESELTGKTDYVFIFDRSDSMGQEGRATAAASTAIICLEALAGVQADIQAMREESGIDVGVDIRTAIYTFNEAISNPKPLSHGLELKEQLDTFAEVSSPGGSNADSHALQTVLDDIPRDETRRQILIVVSDGEADNPALAKTKVTILRQKGWNVYGISIGSEAAVQLYAPDSRRVDDPTKLPKAMQELIKEIV